MSEAKGQLQTLDRAFAALRAVAEAPRPLSIAEVAAAIGTGSTIAFRIVRSLEAHGFLERTEQKRYRAAASGGMTRTLGQGIALLSAVARAGARAEALAAETGLTGVQAAAALGELAGAGLVETTADGTWTISPGILAYARPVLRDDARLAAIRPVMRALVEAHGETVTWYRAGGDQQVVVEAIPSPHPLRYAIEPGTRFPFYVGAAGKAHLAALPEAEAEAYLDGTEFRPFTRHLPDRAALARDLAGIRARGYAISVAERVEGAASVAVAVPAPEQVVAGVLSVMAPLSRTDGAWFERVGADIVARTRGLFGGAAKDREGRAA